LVILNKHGKSAFNWDVTLSYSTIQDAVSSGTDPYNAALVQNLNNGKYTIFTGMFNLIYHPERSPWDAYFNTTYTWAKQTANTSVANFTSQSIGDISPVKFNLGTNYAFNIKKSAFNINLRANYVGYKPEGAGTTVSSNVGIDSTNRIPAYIIFNGALTYRNKGLNHLSVQFTVDNILDALYYAPGPRNANANFVNAISGYVPYVAQRNRNFLFTLKYDL
jgi:outer membrane receptor for ferrienterochelin and colicin